MPEKCIGIRKDGQPCGAYPHEGSEYCISHDPKLARDRAEWRRAGGAATRAPEGEPEALETVDDVRAGLGRVIGSLWELSNTAERARALISAYSAVLKSLEVGELEQRIEAIEHRLETMQRDNMRRAA